MLVCVKSNVFIMQFERFIFNYLIIYMYIIL